MMKPMSAVRADFDRIARFPDEGWNHNSQYHAFLLKQLPARCANALEIGSGTGAFARLLAARCDRVLALDLSPEMIRVAKERSVQYPNIDFQVGDVMVWEFPSSHFDCIASIATLHHLPLEPPLVKMKAALTPGGVLLVLDLYQASGWRDLLVSACAVSVNLLLGLAKNSRPRQAPEAREAWQAHGRDETYLTLGQVGEVCARALPGAQVRRHLLWRYSVVWQKSDAPVSSDERSLQG
jgi:ubiquinone/menaquinone biosynthesis C-methylase UbiE